MEGHISSYNGIVASHYLVSIDPLTLNQILNSVDTVYCTQELVIEYKVCTSVALLLWIPSKNSFEKIDIADIIDSFQF